jgi:hypothetical protein
MTVTPSDCYFNKFQIYVLFLKVRTGPLKISNFSSQFPCTPQLHRKLKVFPSLKILPVDDVISLFNLTIAKILNL